MKVTTLQISKYYFILLLMLGLTPYMNRYYLNILTVLTVIWFMTIIPYLKNINRVEFIIIIYLLYIIGLRLLGYSTASIGNYAGEIIAIVLLLSQRFFQQFNVQESKRIGKIGLVICFLNAVDNLYIYWRYPDIENLTSYTTRLIDTYGNINVYLTMDALSMTFILLTFLILWNIKKQINKKELVLSIIFIYLSFFCLMRATAIIILIIGCVILFIYKFSKNFNNKSKMLLMMVVLGIFIAFLVNWKMLLQTIAGFISSERIQQRIYNLADLFSYTMKTSGSGNSFVLRLQMFIMDIQYWCTDFQTFVFGNGFHRETAATDSVIAFARLNKYSGHTTVGDTLSCYGLLGLGYIICIFIQFYRMWRWRCAGKEQTFICTTFIVVFILSCIANVVYTPSFLFTVLAVLPMYIRGFLKERYLGDEIE